MRTTFSVALGTLIAVAMIVAPLVYYRVRDREHRNFHVVEEGVLYRCGQLTIKRLEQVRAGYGIRAIVSLRDDGADALDEAEEHWAEVRGIKFVRLPYRDFSPDATGHTPADENVKAFRAIMADPANHPVLVHCFAGIHRTGAMCATYRMDFQGWTNAEAMAEMRVMGYTILDEHEDVRSYLARYCPKTPAAKTPIMPVLRPRQPRP